MKIFNKIKDFALDILFPIACLGCGKSDEWLCEECLEKIPLKREQVCPICEKNITPGGRVCFLCRKKSLLDGLLTASYYNNEIKSEQSRQYQFIAFHQKRGIISQMVHYYKYRFVESIAPFLGKILIQSFLRSGLPLPEIIIPVPLHRRRLRWRGFNQSELLANYVSENLTPGFFIPVLSNSLIRRKYTAPQMKIKNYLRRRKNIEGAFEIYPVKSSEAGPSSAEFNRVKNKKILLVDDIATTGATLFECARVLKSAGAAEVFAIVAARQENKK